MNKDLTSRSGKGIFRRGIAVVLIAIALGTGCSGGYDRGSWVDTFVDRYGVSRASADCIMNDVERSGLEDRFVGNSVEIDFDVERVILQCDLSITERLRLGVGP